MRGQLKCLPQLYSMCMSPSNERSARKFAHKNRLGKRGGQRHDNDEVFDSIKNQGPSNTVKASKDGSVIQNTMKIVARCVVAAVLVVQGLCLIVGLVTIWKKFGQLESEIVVLEDLYMKLQHENTMLKEKSVKVERKLSSMFSSSSTSSSFAAGATSMATENEKDHRVLEHGTADIDNVFSNSAPTRSPTRRPTKSPIPDGGGDDDDTRAPTRSPTRRPDGEDDDDTKGPTSAPTIPSATPPIPTPSPTMTPTESQYPSFAPTPCSFDAVCEDLKILVDKLACISAESDSENLILDGCNLHVRDGTGKSDHLAEPTNGLGNVFIGYNEANFQSVKTGAHNLIMGPYHTYTGYGGIAMGYKNKIDKGYSAAIGGQINWAMENSAVTIGGGSNRAYEHHSVTVGGQDLVASGANAVVVGGFMNTASGFHSVAMGGSGNDEAGNFGALMEGTVI